MDTMTNNSQKELIEATPILVWSSIYETGHPEIDDQHVNLVNLINKLGWYRINDTSVEQLTIACRELVEYAQYHFSFEEQLLIPSLLDEEDKTHHINSHEKFHEQALILTKEDANKSGIWLLLILSFRILVCILNNFQNRLFTERSPRYLWVFPAYSRISETIRLYRNI